MADLPRTLGAVVPRNVAAERVRQGWTQAQLAERLGWARQSVSALETGVRQLAGDDLAQLCRALDVTLVDLARGADPEDLRALGLT